RRLALRARACDRRHRKLRDRSVRALHAQHRHLAVRRALLQRPAARHRHARRAPLTGPAVAPRPARGRRRVGGRPLPAVGGRGAWGAGSATVWIAAHLGHTRDAAGVAAITLALATPLRSYASTLFHHATAAALVSVVAALCLDHAVRPRRASRVVAALLAGYAVGVDYQTCLPTGVLLASALVPMRRERRPAVRALVEVV